MDIEPAGDDLPSDDQLYEALLVRDPRFEGRAWVGVTTTGIFCRLTCPARKPKRSSCRFYGSIGACLEAGFRPCRRCHPLAPAAEMEPAVGVLLAALEERPVHRWRERDVVALGLDPSTARRAFRRHFGITFLEMARLRRLRAGFTTLSEGGAVIEAQLDAGFESPSAFRAAFARLLGAAPGVFLRDALLRADWIDTPLGPMVAVCDERSLHLLEFVDRRALPRSLRKLRAAVKGSLGFGRFAVTDRVEEELGAFFAGDSATFGIPLVLHGTPLTQEVWTALRRIPAGETRTYSELARAVGRPRAVRAVARANGANQIALIVPCHRVLGADGSLTGYGGGLWRKQRLIELERDFRERNLLR
ncbi:MAG: trifunctional transcriptional activator/DNA repair protein Ada/methylated-DNA--[protein]-cysteine S-methyltransferase [Acidobacteriota bacterium]